MHQSLLIARRLSSRLCPCRQDAPTEQARVSAALHGRLAARRGAVRIDEPTAPGDLPRLTAHYAPCIRAPGAPRAAASCRTL